ncbi:MAG: GNAT family N-acetyltransferase [Nannocystaceae bacterium]|nr:GNAT family N-acetyltransferase [Myxococcales bacterium]
MRPAITIHDDAADLLEAADAFLYADEPTYGLLLGIAAAAARRDDEAASFLSMSSGTGIEAVCMRTPPWKCVVSRGRPEAMARLAEALHARDPKTPGVGGPDDAAQAFAEAWVARTGQPLTVGMRLRIHRLDEVNTISLPDGRMRPATADDRPRLNAWADSFAEHAGTDDPRAGADVIEGVLRDGEIYLWEDDGPRSMAAWVRPTRNGASISLVYTPPEHRGRGYASGLVAGISQALLDRGRRFTTLFTDQKNPTSNKIYARIGYQAICDWRDLWFVERAGR